MTCPHAVRRPAGRAARRARRRRARPRAVYDAVVAALAEDLPAASDVTSAATIPADAQGDGRLRRPRARRGRRARRRRAGLPLRHGRRRSTVTDRVPDGTRVARRRRRDAGRPARPAGCSPPSAPRSTSPRHLSGVATATAAWVAALDGHPRPGARHPQDAARPTAPCRSTPCAAAAASTTGSASRDMAMVKDNHVVAAGGVVPAYQAVRAAYPDLRVEVEVTDLDQLRELLDAGCDRDPARQHGRRDDGRGGPRSPPAGRRSRRPAG